MDELPKLDRIDHEAVRAHAIDLYKNGNYHPTEAWAIALWTFWKKQGYQIIAPKDGEKKSPGRT